MNGCSMPVVINSGSGNQGMTCSLPVIEYAKELKVSKEKLYRALVVSNLVAIHQKSYIGSLSAYCGAVSAACGAGAAIAWLNGGDYEAVARTITNALANTSGMVCDGRNPRVQRRSHRQSMRQSWPTRLRVQTTASSRAKDL